MSAELGPDEAATGSSFWDGVAEYTKAAQAACCEPAAWAAQVSTALAASGVALPSPELAQLLAYHLDNCGWAPLAWKYVEQALAADVASPMLLISLLSVKIFPTRCSKPIEYRLYLELIKRYAFSFTSLVKGTNFKRTMALINDVLRLSDKFDVQSCEPSVLVVEYVFSIVWHLLDSALDDEGLLELVPEKLKWGTRSQDLKMDEDHNYGGMWIQNGEEVQKLNTVMSIEIMWHFLHQKVTSKLLLLARENMPSWWTLFTHRLHILATKSLALRVSTVTVSVEKLNNYLHDNWKNFARVSKLGSCHDFAVHLISRSPTSYDGYCHEGSNSALWIPIDLYLEDRIFGSIAATSSVEILSGLVKALQAVNGCTWYDAFLSILVASLRLVQRERDPPKSPIPRHDTRLCMLLSITVLCIASIVEEEESSLRIKEQSNSQSNDSIVGGKRRKDLALSIQKLGDYESLLIPPQTSVLAANQAAKKAMIFVSSMSVHSGYVENSSMTNKEVDYSGSLWHLIVESCISRNLLDTSAYFWPGYLKGNMNKVPNYKSDELYAWSTLWKGAPLTPALVDALVATPASSLGEFEKIAEIAANGSDDDKLSAARILCGESLIHGWNIQEHVLRCILDLLSLPISWKHGENEDYWISCCPLLHVILTRVSSSDCVQLFSFHGLVPELAGALMSICENLGSFFPNASWTKMTGERISVHAVFSLSFVVLSRLWNFNHPKLEYCRKGDIASANSQVTLEHLLLLRNFYASCSSNIIRHRHAQLSAGGGSLSSHPIFLDSFPKLKRWYRQHQACIASALPGLVHETRVHGNVDEILQIMLKKYAKENDTSFISDTSTSVSIITSFSSGSDDTSSRPQLSAWDIMDAVPFAIDAVLTACSQGELSPRELATGIKLLADFFPASLVIIVSYFSAEVTRGIWKPAHMNGIDWPSPAENLPTVEEYIKKILAGTGVNAPSLSTDIGNHATLPLPLAAFVSLTITFRVDKSSEHLLVLTGPALRSLSSSCPWPSMAIIAALWAQKVKQRAEFLMLSVADNVFHCNNDAVVQLLKSCFSSTLGLSTSFFSNGGVSHLLGLDSGSYATGSIPPGILYLRVYRSIKNVGLLAENVLYQLMVLVEEIAEKFVSMESISQPKKTKYETRYRKFSFSAAMTQVKVAAALGATFAWFSGGPGLAKLLFEEILPSWFLSVHQPHAERSGRAVHVLSGQALAYFATLSGMFFWDIGSPPASKRRSKVITCHMEFIACVLEEKIRIGCDWTLWNSYVSRFLLLMIECAPCWVLGVETSVLKRISRGLRQWNQQELAFALLCKGGIETMGAAAEAIITAD